MNKEKLLDFQSPSRVIRNSRYPVYVFWGFIPLIVIYSFIFLNPIIDIQQHDTYYVIARLHFQVAVSIFFGVIGLVYLLLEKFALVRFLTFLHVIATIIFLSYLILFSNFFRAISDTVTFISSSQEVHLVGQWSYLIFICSNFLFLVNIVIGLFRGR